MKLTMKGGMILTIFRLDDLTIFRLEGRRKRLRVEILKGMLHVQCGHSSRQLVVILIHYILTRGRLS